MKQEYKVGDKVKTSIVPGIGVIVKITAAANGNLYDVQHMASCDTYIAEEKNIKELVEGGVGSGRYPAGSGGEAHPIGSVRYLTSPAGNHQYEGHAVKIKSGPNSHGEHKVNFINKAGQETAGGEISAKPGDLTTQHSSPRYSAGKTSQHGL